jgi:hypothetical protein
MRAPDLWHAYTYMYLSEDVNSRLLEHLIIHHVNYQVDGIPLF